LIKVLAIEKTRQLVQSLEEFSKQNSFESVEQSLFGIFDTVANTLIVRKHLPLQLSLSFYKISFFKGLSSPLNSLSPFLEKDFVTSSQIQNSSRVDETKLQQKTTVEMIFLYQ